MAKLGDMRAVVGLTTRTLPLRAASRERLAETLPRAYAEAVLEAGGLPLALPNPDDAARAEDYLERIDALVLTGGDDPHPGVFGEPPHPRIELVDPRRDRFEIALVRSARARGLPVLGICRGLQLLNVALGGDIFQDIASQTDSTVAHAQKTIGDAAWHEIEIMADSRLAGAVGAGRRLVNSFHHQACRRLADGLLASAHCVADGLVEALEDPDLPFFLGVQWHPEVGRLAGDRADAALFRAFVDSARPAGRAASN